ncbi:hypothetical protein EST38_g7623 [Candolleomyces aberdarensis]|uniref:Uncharacterized protein n=1 Tax=Candolleomyces aberdarensis TaxID=2316362 RepID=A0A4Q2DF68_9AGAR|nr:hypothetical protein EST38_g7623 [Candolleomyces aberdarensis]
MDILSSPVPQISISLAPPQEAPVEPYSPFGKTSFNLPSQPDDTFRPLHLTPPPTSSRFPRPLSPLSVSQGSPVERRKPTGLGLDKTSFDALLKSSKEKPAKKDLSDLRKEVALKAHKHRQAERRALFLSKVLAPPSPTAAVTPKTPPESPSIFHYRLPSPGLVSPIVHYESLHDQDDQNGISPFPCKPWVEQVDFRLLKKRRGLPSLEQITARMNLQGRNDKATQSAPPTVSEPQPRLVVGRLKMPIRNSTTPTITISPFPGVHGREKPLPPVPPRSPLLTTPSDLQVTTLVVPHSQSTSPTELTQVNLLALNSRETRSSAMLKTLRRRTQSALFHDQVRRPILNTTDEMKASRRHSAPPDSSPFSKRSGFEHPILSLPGAF